MTNPSAVPLDEIQGLVLHGYGHLREARFVLLGVRAGHAAQARRYLASLPLTSASTAVHREQEPGPFVNVAFTHAGLEALGLDATLLDDFPRDFVEGPTTVARARLLGDQGESGPAKWVWGSPHTPPVHAMLLLYASGGIDALCATYLQAAAAAGLDAVRCLDTIRLPRRQEHFGFRDGIAQPVVKDAGAPGPAFDVETGEIFLGHPNGFGEVAHVPGGGHTPFARNGSYLVTRQLEQDVPGFWAACRAAVASDDEAIHLASRMVGRWPGGTPLVLDARGDSMAASGFTDHDRNAFEYDDADKLGLKCPFGAHVRRSNPRDWGVAASAAESRKVVSRHRIIRRGRAYGIPFCPDAEPLSYLKALGGSDPGGPRGLHFLCFNANIEQQFEFVQRQWCGNPKFAGAVNGADPLLGEHHPLEGDPPTFSIERETTAERIPLTARFVHTRGAAYLFMPTIAAVASLGVT